MGGDLASSFGERKKFFPNQINFRMTFLGKISMFTPQISNDLFQLSTFFSLFPLHHLYEKRQFNQNNFSLTPFPPFCKFRTLLITLLLQILGGRMHGPSPTSNLGAVPQSP